MKKACSARSNKPTKTTPADPEYPQVLVLQYAGFSTNHWSSYRRLRLDLYAPVRRSNRNIAAENCTIMPLEVLTRLPRTHWKDSDYVGTSPTYACNLKHA